MTELGQRSRNVVNQASSEEFGTFAEARLMLEQAILEVKADKVRAFRMFNGNHPRFRDRDLFVFCFNAEDGIFTAHEAMMTHDARELVDPAGFRLGATMLTEAREGKVVEIAYWSPFPGSTFRARKRAFVTRVEDQICGVSAYLYNAPGSSSIE